MKMKKQPKAYIFYMGIIIFAAGLLLKFIFPEAAGVMQSLPFVMSGFGAGLIGVGISVIFRKKMIENDPEKVRQYEIAEKDERNIRIREKAGYATWYTTLFLLVIISLTLVVLNYTAAGFVALGALLIHAVSFFLYTYLYSKKI